MINRIFFSYRFKLLKQTHYLSNSQLATLLGLKSKGSVGNILTGKNVPLADNLLDIANLFSVSIDWLIGRSEIPYTNEILLQLEDYFWNTYTKDIFTNSKFANIFPQLPEIYLNKKKRAVHYPLPIRANILYLLFCIFSTAVTEISSQDTIKIPPNYPFDCTNKNSNILQTDLDIHSLLSESETYSSYLKFINKKYSLSILELLKKLLSKEISTPLFDISPISEENN